MSQRRYFSVPRFPRSLIDIPVLSNIMKIYLASFAVTLFLYDPTIVSTKTISTDYSEIPVKDKTHNGKRKSESQKENVLSPENPTPTQPYAGSPADLPSTDVVTKEIAPNFIFAEWDNEGKICMLAKFSATFTITYSSMGGEQTVSVNLPESARFKGGCATEKLEPTLELSWSGFRLLMMFKTVKPPGKSEPTSWELMSMELAYNTANNLFDGATNAGKKTARREENFPLFSTPMGKSYFCPSPDVIPLLNTKKDKAVLARFKDVRLQIYDIQKGKFSPAQRCSLVRIGGIPEPFAQDETVPIAVGSTLAVVAVLVVVGYALYRNVATRRTDYSTME